MSNKIPVPSGYDVYWEKWTDAYQEEIESDAERDSLKPTEDEQNLDPFSFEEEDSEPMHFSEIKTIFTPFGILPLTEHSLASNHFKFWVGHTNFKIPANFYNLIATVKGVEAVDIFSPYRFRIAVGRLFQDRDVMSGVRGSILNYIVTDKKANDANDAERT